MGLKRWGLLLAPLLVATLDGHAQSDERYYLSGMLVFGENNRCGLVRINVIDRSSCRIPDQFCSDHRELLNKRVRISAIPTRCTDPGALRCGQRADFYEENFNPNRCFSRPQLVDVLKL